ncbi:MAG TPA: YafY family protein [Candidatus Limnocylindria bacterium]|nr:YafY family protein [Candidatus Limnocylindria bacterium]
MRASRLLSMLLMLQTRGRMTAQQLADEMEVSVRTVYRDADQLAAAGIPIYADRGPAGGYQLLDGYRTRLTGLTQDEAGSLFFAGMPAAAAELGLGTVLATAQLKLLAALPTELRSRAGRIRERFHFDAPTWFAEADAAPHLGSVAEAVWSQRRLRIMYRRDGIETERVLEPLGIVLKGGAWYLVAQVAGGDGAPRTYRVSRIRAAEPLDERFERPPDFDLAEHWASSIALYEAEIPRLPVTLRIDPSRVWMLAMLAGALAVQRATTLDVEDPDGWRHLVIEMDWPDEAANRLVGLGGVAEVLAPAELREQVAAVARGALARHGDGGD